MAASSRPISEQKFLDAAFSGDDKTVRKYVISTDKRKRAEFRDQAIANFDAKLGYQQWRPWQNEFLPIMAQVFTATNDDEQTALHLAAKEGHIKVVETLFDLEPTIIHRNIFEEKTSAPLLLLNKLDINKNTPLIIAAANGHLNIVKAFFTYAAGLQSPVGSNGYFFKKNLLQYASLKNNKGQNAALAALEEVGGETGIAIAKYIENAVGHKLIPQELYKNPPQQKKKEDPLQAHSVFKVGQKPLPQTEEKSDDKETIKLLTNEVATLKKEMDIVKQQLAIVMDKLAFASQPSAYMEDKGANAPMRAPGGPR